MIRLPRLQGISRGKYEQRPSGIYVKKSDKQEFAYRNNPTSLFRKYKELVTKFANTHIGRDYLDIPNFTERISLLIPNGFHKLTGQNKKQYEIEFNFYSRAVFALKLYPALYHLDLVLPWIQDVDEAMGVFLWGLNLRKIIPPYYQLNPSIISQVRFASTTFYPDANPETTTVDGAASQGTSSTNWAGKQNANGTTSSDSATNEYFYYLDATSSATNPWNWMNRGFALFDTSSLPNGATKDSASIDLYVLSVVDQLSQSCDIVESNPASNTAIAASDYEGLRAFTTLLATSKTIASLTTSAYNSWTLNSSGLTNISLTGISKFGFRLSGDTSNIEPTWVSTNSARVNHDAADKPDTTTDPKLIVNYTETTTSTSTSTTSTSSSTSTTSTSSSTSTTSTSSSTSSSTSTTSTSSSTSSSTSTTSTSSSTSSSTSTTSTSSSTSTTSTSSSTSTSTTSTSSSTSSSTSTSTTVSVTTSTSTTSTSSSTSTTSTSSSTSTSTTSTSSSTSSSTSTTSTSTSTSTTSTSSSTSSSTSTTSTSSSTSTSTTSTSSSTSTSTTSTSSSTSSSTSTTSTSSSTSSSSSTSTTTSTSSSTSTTSTTTSTSSSTSSSSSSSTSTSTSTTVTKEFAFEVGTGGMRSQNLKFTIHDFHNTKSSDLSFSVSHGDKKG